MKKIKILYIVTRPIYGGVIKLVLSILERLDKNKFEYSIITGGNSISDKDMTSEIKIKGIDLILILELVREIHPFKDLIAFIKLYYLIKRIKPDIVHTHTSKAGILGRLAAKLAGTAIIIHTPHGSIFNTLYFNRFVLFFFAFAERFASRLTDKIITICNDEEEEYLSYGIGDKDKFIRIYSGIDLKEFGKIKTAPLEIKKAFGIPNSAKVIGNISRLSYEKGHLVLLKAFLQINNTFPNTYLLLIGEGKLRKRIEKEAKTLGIEKQLILTGLRKDVPGLLSIIDIFVHPSLCDSFPLAIIEAMAIGKPIIATKTGGIPEIIDDNQTALLIEPGDSRALADAAIFLLGNENRMQELARQAQIKSQLFDINNVIKKIEDVYLTIFEKKSDVGKCKL